VVLGDSISDGVGSTPGADQRWPDQLARRLVAQRGRSAPAVVNAGLAGNQLLSDGVAFGGQNALARLDRDVLSVPGITHVIVEEGVNDLLVGGDTPPSAEAVIAGLRQIIARARIHGVKIIGCTITPSAGGRFALTPSAEAVAQKVNDWIRTSGAFDGVADFDAAVRDPQAPERMRAAFRSEDGLHPNDAGARALAEAVDLSSLR
jgi:lysophospholipase L1-like esterase